MGEVKRLHGIELVKAGEWETSTRDWRVTTETLTQIVDAFTHAGLRKPVIKIGHTDERFPVGDGEPAFGYVEGLRLADGGRTLVGDLVMPRWLADAAPMHFPDRSVEAALDYTVAGRQWPCVLTAVALLGAERPAVSTLGSLQDLVAASRRRVVLTAAQAPSNPHHTTVIVAAARRRRAHHAHHEER